VNLVHSCINDWKTTPWRKVDVENMDIECKKFAKEIRGLQINIYFIFLFNNILLNFGFLTYQR